MNTQLFSQTGHLWILICVVHLTVSYYHVTYTFQSESTLYKPVWLSGWVFIYKLSGCGFESCCFHFDHSFSKFLFPSLADTIVNYLTMLLNFGYFWLKGFPFHDNVLQSVPLFLPYTIRNYMANFRNSTFLGAPLHLMILYLFTTRDKQSPVHDFFYKQLG